MFVVLSVLTGCKEDQNISSPKEEEPTPITVPTSYSFARNGESSVSYSGQTDRLNQLTELMAHFQKGNQGKLLDANDLSAMFSNEGENGNGLFSFSSSKQLKDKTFEVDRDWFEDLFVTAETASQAGHTGVTAKDGVAGLLVRESKSTTILVDENGRELGQLIEKGLMGATFLYQIFNTYLTDDRIGDAVDNSTIEPGDNYTEMEHHMDEAFGYFGAPIDFESNYTGSGDVIYWANYSDGSDDLVGFNSTIMDAFKIARAAIVANRYDVKNEQRDILYLELERLAAATAIHYANEALVASNDGDRLHVLSECYAFIRALRYGHPNYRKMTPQQVDNLLDSGLGSNFWLTTSSGLSAIKTTLAQVYDLENVKNDL